jgi:hypothetical protein
MLNMKKRILLVFAVIMLCFSAVCSAASNGALLSSEEKVADKVFSVISGESAYVDLVGDFSTGLVKNLPENKFTELKKAVKDKLGTLKEPQLAVLQKFGNADRVIYVAKGTKVQAVEIAMTFEVTGRKPLLNEISLRPLEVKKQAPATDKK